MDVQQQNNTFEFNIHFGKGRNGRKQIRIGQKPEATELPEGRTPRISKLLALAIKMDGMLQRGEVKNYAELAVLGHVTRARITQIMNLLNLAPDIQEELLNLELTRKGKDTIQTRIAQDIARELNWPEQRTEWKRHTKQRL